MPLLRSALASAAVLLAAAPARGGEAGERELGPTLRSIVEGAPLGGARTSVLVADVASGEVLYAKDADVLLNPASNVKLVTSAAALARLGPEYRFATELYLDRGASPSAPRTLHVRGKGDPTLVTERLWAIAGELAHLGVGRIGDVVVDESFFDRERVGPGFDQESGDRSYLAPSGAASLNWNTVAVYVAPGDRRGGRGRVEVEPASELIELENRTTTVRANGRRRVEIASAPSAAGKQRIVVTGRIPLGSRVHVTWRRIDEPALYLGHTLRRLLELRGVKASGRVRVGEVPSGARLVHVSESESLGEIVRRLNKTSNNFVAEQLLRTLGAEVKGGPGSWAKGVQAAEEFLAEVGIPRGAYVMKNGSGLNDTNRFSARQLVTLLRAMWSRFPLHAEFLASLPVAGRDGTIRWRMEGTDAVGRLRAKTGTLENVTSLSGYVESGAGRTLAFAVLVNDFPGRAGTAARSVDAIGVTLAARGGAPGAGVARRAGAAGAPADLGAAATTYYALGRAGDARNLQVLRTALRAEADPALRLALAECVYLSEPDGDTSRRTFLEAVPADAQVLARLWAAARGAEPGVPAPVLPSLGDLAAEGNPEALAKLVEIAPASALDAGLAAALADVVAEVAAAAPEELVAALRASPAAAQEAALAALGAGVSRSEEREHPFPAALRALSEKDGELAAFARALVPRLAAAVSAGAASRAVPAIVPASVPASPPAGAAFPARAPGGG